MNFKPYPLTVKPILKEKVWGGRNLRPYIDIYNRKIGEAWILSDQGENKSIVSAGPLKGLTLSEIIKKYPAQVMGKDLIKKYGKRFPLLIKYIDANDRLSVQVHPDDEYAKRRGFPAGKTEMWYVLGGRSGATLLAGFKGRETKKTLAEAIKKGTLAEKLKKFSSAKGDCFFIPAGTVHALEKGNVMLEIQQSSDITYRIYDWGRTNPKNERKLNIINALNSVKFGIKNVRVGSKKTAISNHVRMRTLVRCRYFDCDEVIIEKNAGYWYNEKSCMVINVVDGEIHIDVKDGGCYSYGKGSLILIPCGLTGMLLRALKTARLVITRVK